MQACIAKSIFDAYNENLISQNLNFLGSDIIQIWTNSLSARFNTDFHRRTNTPLRNIATNNKSMIKNTHHQVNDSDIFSAQPFYSPTQETIQAAINHEFFTRTVLAGLEIIRLLRSQDSILHDGFGIGAGGDCSSGADLLAEAIFCKFLLPIYNIDSEEAGFLEAHIKTPYTIILDPLDGSSNFKSNIPYYGASLALCDENGRVCEACVINYISHEISYLNDDLLKITQIPYIFTLDSIGLYIPFEVGDSKHVTLGLNNGSLQGILPYRPIDFSPLFDYRQHRESGFMNSLHQDFKNDSKLFIEQMCAYILGTKKYLPKFNKELLALLFEHKVIVRKFEPSYPTKILECGIFEKASYHPDWVAYLLKHKLKFRSLGATALSLGFSFRYLFVLLPSSVRRYDGMAGFYLAQNQSIRGDVSNYLQAIPNLQKCLDNHSHIIISTDSKIVEVLSNSGVESDR